MNAQGQSSEERPQPTFPNTSQSRQQQKTTEAHFPSSDSKREGDSRGEGRNGAGAPVAHHRPAYVSVNHLLSFEVTSSKGGLGELPRRPPRHGPKPGANFTKERFIHANFRFVALEDVVKSQETYNMDPDIPLDWNEIELVIVPAQHDVTCPICLDAPLGPRLTKCGHFFCWPCILRYAAVNDASGSGNWRKCPICFESINVKHLRSVRFTQVEDYTSPASHINEIGIPMALLKGDTASCKIEPLTGNLKPSFRKTFRTFEDLSPFQRVTLVDRKFVADNVISYEKEELKKRLKETERKSNHQASNQFPSHQDNGDDDYDNIGFSSGTEEIEVEGRTYVELALTMVDDRLKSLLDGKNPEIPSPPIQGISQFPDTHSPKIHLAPRLSSPLFFHQASDGQPYFLCPLNIKILRRQFGTYDAFPVTLCAPVLEIEMAIITEEIRKRYKYLHHLPLGCQFGLCEVDLSGIVSANILAEFSEEIKARATSRRQKAKREAKMAAEAYRRDREQRLMMDADLEFTYDESLGGGRSASPGVASSLFFCDDYENFPLPSHSLPPVTGTVPIITPPSKMITPGSQLANSFASIAATSPQSDSFVVVQTRPATFSNAGPSTSAFAFSFDEINIPSIPSDEDPPLPGEATLSNSGHTTGTASVSSPHSRKGKKMVLVSNLSRRTS